MNGTNMKIAAFISVINQLDAQNFCFTISFISCLYMFRAHVLIIRGSKFYYTASGIITSIGVLDLIISHSHHIILTNIMKFKKNGALIGMTFIRGLMAVR